jgi:predicted Zn-dependent protease
VLIFALFFSMLAIAPLSVAAQTRPEDQNTAKNEEKDKSDKDKKDKKDDDDDKKPNSSAGKALKPNEDPSLIGQRKINKGTDKLFGWLGGSREKEMEIGRQLSLQVEQQAKLVEDPMVTEYVNRVGQNIVLHSDAKIPFTIKVIDSDEVNAFALPGGYFYVNSGLILAADNEAELAGVMAHEIAHVAARHAMENQGKGALISYGAIAGIIFGGPILSTVLQNSTGILGTLAMLKFSRGAEEEADRLGVQYLYASGYDPNGMATMFEKLAAQNKKKPGSLTKLFSSHPQSLDRRDESIALVSRFPEKDEYIISTSEFQRVKEHLMKLTNVAAKIQLDDDGDEPTRPTLKRRSPEGTDEDGTSSSSSSSSSSDKKETRDAPGYPERIAE